MKIDNLIIIQSRNGSSRLPFKSSLSIVGLPTLLHVVNRINLIAKFSFKLIVATSTNNEDQPLEDLCKIHSIECYRGHPDNVFSRYKDIASKYKPKNIIRITGDCPLIHFQVIESLIDIMNNNDQIEYASNTIKRTFPHGFDVEIFRSFVLLEKDDPNEEDKEHVTPYMYNSENFNKFSLENKEDNSFLRVTLDTSRDFIFINSLLNLWLLNEKKNSPYDALSSYQINNLINSSKELKIMHEIAKNNI